MFVYKIFGMKKSLFFVCIMFEMAKAFAQQVQFVDEYSFLKASWGQEFGNLEDTNNPDLGGLISLFLRNSDPNSTDKVVQVRAFSGSQEIEIDGWRCWPEEIPSTSTVNNVSFLNIKGIVAGLGENSSVDIEVTLESGSILTKTIENVTPKVKLANIMPNQQMNKLYIYFRNDGTQNFSLNQLNINNWNMEVGNTPELQIIGGINAIEPKGTLIIELTYPFSLTVNTPLSIRAKFTNLVSNETQWTTAGVRLVPSEFPLGSWHSSAFNPDNLAGRHNLRELGINTLHGPGNPNLMAQAHSKYFMRTIWEPNFGNPFNAAIGAQTVFANAGQPFINAWSVDDEPDLNGKEISEQLSKSLVYWKNDPSTPSYVNLCVQKKYQRYGWHTDIVAMDHYTSPAAPNVIPLSWIPVIGRIGSLREALEYSDYLKYNLEPRRTWTWSQLAGNVWNYPPLDFEVNYQFWAHLMGGAKGLEWFVAQANTKNNFSEQWNEAVKLIRQLNPIKNQILYAEPVKIVQTNTNRIDSRALVSKDAMIVIVANNDATYNFSLSTQRWNGVSNPNNFVIEFTVPHWINIEQSYQALSGIKSPIQNLEDLGNRKYRISGNIHKEGLVFVFAKNDTQAPDAPTGLNIAHFFNDEDFVLSWKEPFDDFGINKYEIFADDSMITEVYHPIFFAKNSINYCDVNIWKVRALDASGNISDFNTYQPVIEITDIAPEILTQPSNASVSLGQDTSFTIVANGNFLMYNWYYSLDDGNTWIKILDNQTFSGAKTSQLNISNTPETLHNALFKGIVREFCTDLIVESNPAKLIISNLGAQEISPKNIIIYPNPAGDFIQISGLQSDEPMQIKIWGIQGNLMQIVQKSTTSGVLHLDINTLDAGIYFLEMKSENYFGVKKFVKK